MQETRVLSLGWEDPLEKEMATHSSTLAWKIPWTEKPGRLQSMGSQSRTRLSDFTFFHFHFPSPLPQYSCLVDGLDWEDYGHRSTLVVQVGQRTPASWPQWLAPQGHVTQAGPIRVIIASWQSSREWIISSYPWGFWDPTAMQRAFSGSEVRPTKQLWERLWFRDSHLIPKSHCAWRENAPRTFQLCVPHILFCFS